MVSGIMSSPRCVQSNWFVEAAVKIENIILYLKIKKSFIGIIELQSCTFKNWLHGVTAFTDYLTNSTVSTSNEAGPEREVRRNRRENNSNTRELL